MKLYLISQNANTGYDTYDTAVVAATSPHAARRIHPNGRLYWLAGRWQYLDGTEAVSNYCWAHSGDVQVEYLGVAKAGTKAGVICASFNAG